MTGATEASKFSKFFTPLTQIEKWSFFDYIFIETSDPNCRPRWIEKLDVSTNEVEKFDINELGHKADENRLYFKDAQKQMIVAHNKATQLSSYEFSFKAVDGQVAATTRFDMYNCFSEQLIPIRYS